MDHGRVLASGRLDDLLGAPQVHIRVADLAAPARDDLVRRLEQAFDHEILEEATFRVRGRVEAKTWEAFRLLTEERRPGPEVARHLGLEVTTVYVAKKRVVDLLREEIRQLEAGDEAEP